MTKIASISNYKYKDERPLQTITRIRNILANLGILTIETGWRNSAAGFYSVTIMIQNTHLSTNGKGTTYEYALASAYGELMERLQNLAFYRLNIDLPMETLASKGFYYAPDELVMKTDDLLNQNNDWFQCQLSRLTGNIPVKEILQKWQSVSYEEIPADFIALPYFNVKNERVSYIPIKMASKMYMTNGMCAGNTPEEALVQGISEVLERYVNKRIVLEKITPPTIPQSFLQNHPQIEAMIAQLKASGNFEVMLKDCSLNQGLPVIGVIFINKDDQTYFVKFGAHPIFEIAAERTLTELLQGQDVRNMRGVKEYYYKIPVTDPFHNLLDIFVNGCGYYPAEFFSQRFSYPFQPFKDVREMDNRNMLIHLLTWLEWKGYDVFLRNNSFLSFPSFQVIIPGLSEVEEFDHLAELDDYAQFNQIKKFLRNPDRIPGPAVETIVSYLSRPGFNHDFSMIQMLNLPMKEPYPWYYSCIQLFITALYYQKKDFHNAYQIFSRFLQNVDSLPYYKTFRTFYQCIRDYIGARIDNLPKPEAVDRLSVFYPPEVIQEVLTDFGHPEQIFDTYGKFNCWSCSRCQLNSQCSYMEVEKIYRVLKEKYASDHFNQYHMRELLGF